MLQLLSQEQVANASPCQNINGSVETISSRLPKPTQDSVQSIRIGLRDVASKTALKVQHLSQATVEQALEIGQLLWRVQRDLKLKEYKAFLSILGWATTKARKFINLVKIFDYFEPSQLVRVELTTLLSLCSSRYSSVVAQLQETQNITQQLVEQLIKANRPQRKQNKSPISGWKQNRVGGGRCYEVILHDEETGLSIEQQAEVEGILPQRIIQEAIALRSQQKFSSIQSTEYVAAQAVEFQAVVEQARSLDTENQKLMGQLQERARTIAELEARLAEATSTTNAIPSEIKQVSDISYPGGSVLVEQDDAQEQNNLDQSTRVSPFEPNQTWSDVAAAVGCNRNELLKLVKPWTLEQRQALVKPLSAYLEIEPNALDQITWIPKNLLDKALSTLSFKVRIIGGANNLADEPEIEYVHNCAFVSLEYPGSRSEQWIFRDGNNKLYPIFGRDEFEIEISDQ